MSSHLGRQADAPRTAIKPSIASSCDALAEGCDTIPGTALTFSHAPPRGTRMRVEKRVRGGTTVIDLAGRFDVTEAPQFEETFKDIAKNKPRHVAFDFTAVEYIDSSGIGALIKAFNIVRADGSEMLLFGLRPPVLAVFKVSQLDTFFTVLSKDEFEAQYPA